MKLSEIPSLKRTCQKSNTHNFSWGLFNFDLRSASTPPPAAVTKFCSCCHVATLYTWLKLYNLGAHRTSVSAAGKGSRCPSQVEIKQPTTEVVGIRSFRTVSAVGGITGLFGQSLKSVVLKEQSVTTQSTPTTGFLNLPNPSISTS